MTRKRTPKEPPLLLGSLLSIDALDHSDGKVPVPFRVVGWLHEATDTHLTLTWWRVSTDDPVVNHDKNNEFSCIVRSAITKITLHPDD